MINITKCYEIWDVNDLSIGEATDQGFEFIDKPHTFLDLVRELRLNFYGGELSQTGRVNADTWVRVARTIIKTGQEDVRSLHFGTNDAKATKYWIKALKVAGLR